MSLIKNLGLIWKNRKIITTASNSFDTIKEAQMKSGWKTSEFWMTAVGQLMTLAGALNGVLDPKTAAIISASLTGVYGVLRTLAKNPDITTVVSVQSPTTTAVVTPPAP